VKVHSPLTPAMLVETFVHDGVLRSLQACTTYSAPGVPAKVTVTEPSPLSWMPSLIGVYKPTPRCRAGGRSCGRKTASQIGIQITVIAPPEMFRITLIPEIEAA
jgi:hypothetical protein